MIVAVGLDLVDVSRIEKAMQRPQFLDRILTPAELELIGSDPMRVAGRWAAKEATYKALGIADLQWHDVEILGEVRKAPTIRITHPAYKPETMSVHLSISHEKGHAAAVVIFERLD